MCQHPDISAVIAMQGFAIFGADAERPSNVHSRRKARWARHIAGSQIIEQMDKVIVAVEWWKGWFERECFDGH
jgi:hypothetical protein